MLRVVAFLLFLVPACLSTLLVPHFGTALGIAVGIVAYWTALTLSIVFYRVGPLHPLYQYPGPLPAKISKWWHVWHVRKGKQHLYLKQLHEKYGDIVRIGAYARYLC